MNSGFGLGTIFMIQNHYNNAIVVSKFLFPVRQEFIGGGGCVVLTPWLEALNDVYGCGEQVGEKYSAFEHLIDISNNQCYRKPVLPKTFLKSTYHTYQTHCSNLRVLSHSDHKLVLVLLSAFSGIVFCFRKYT